MGSRRYSDKERSTINLFKSISEKKCYYCGMDLSKKHHSQVTVDHKTPISRGGETIYSNLAIACHMCNEEKDDMTEHEYREYLAEKDKQIVKEVYATKRLTKPNKDEINIRFDSRNIDVNSIIKKKKPNLITLLEQASNDNI